jgi:ubiquinone/menaquinone biosynthesis C-methylase UbiE
MIESSTTVLQMPEDKPSSQNAGFVEKFLHNVRGTIPLSIEQIDIMLHLIAAARHDRVDSFLDLGCGDGVLAKAIFDEHPDALGLLVDFSEPMLEAARAQVEAPGRQLELIHADFHQPDWIREVTPHAPLDVIVSGFALHLVPDARKRALYREIYQLLAPEGIFINIEHVSSATRWTESVWDDYLIDAIFGRELKASRGRPRAQIARDYYARSGKHAEEPAPLEVQCDWLREIGFESVECYLKVQELALFGGQRPA